MLRASTTGHTQQYDDLIRHIGFPITAAWRNGIASDYDYKSVNQEIAGSTPAVVNMFTPEFVVIRVPV
jgi:hypothetical protein